MPIIEFHLLEGRTVDQKRRLCDAVTNTVVDVLGVRREQVRILIHDLPPENFSIAGITALDRAAGDGKANAITEAPINGATNGKGVSA